MKWFLNKRAKCSLGKTIVSFSLLFDRTPVFYATRTGSHQSINLSILLKHLKYRSERDADISDQMAFLWKDQNSYILEINTYQTWVYLDSIIFLLWNTVQAKRLKSITHGPLENRLTWSPLLPKPPNGHAAAAAAGESSAFITGLSLDGPMHYDVNKTSG